MRATFIPSFFPKAPASTLADSVWLALALPREVALPCEMSLSEDSRAGYGLWREPLGRGTARSTALRPWPCQVK